MRHAGGLEPAIETWTVAPKSTAGLGRNMAASKIQQLKLRTGAVATVQLMHQRHSPKAFLRRLGA